MKKITFFIFLFFFTLSNYSQQIAAIPSQWESSFWNGASWTTVANVTYTFDSNCLPIEVHSTVTINNVTSNASLSITTYDSNLRATETVTQIWNGGWENSVRSTFTYTGNLITEVTNYQWISNDWELHTRTLNTYNGSNMIIEHVSENRVSNSWELALRTVNTYTGSDKPDVITNYTRNGNNWDQTSRATHTYNGSDYLTTVENSIDNGLGWENGSLDTYSYDGSNYVIEILRADWNGSTYADATRSTIINNADGYPIDTIDETWQVAFWLNTSRVEIDYNECASVLGTEKYEEIITEVYPNPVSDRLNIDFKEPFEGEISIFDIQGRNLYKGSYNKSEKNIDISQFTDGVYFLVVESEKKRMVKRIIIEK